MDKYNNIPIDIQISIKKLRQLIKIVEKNIYMHKDSILMEITIQLDITIEAARKLFSLYYPFKGSLSTYIVERKRTKTVNSILNMNNDLLIERKIEEIANCSRAYFDRMLYKSYGVRIKDLKRYKDISKPFVKVFDVDALEESISKAYDFLYSLSEMGYIDIKRTKIRVGNIDWNIALRVIFSMREYIYFEEEKDLDKLINYDIFLQKYEDMEELKDYDPLYVIDYYTNNEEEIESEKIRRKLDFILCYNGSSSIEVEDLKYYFVDRYKFKSVIDRFILPKELSNYKSVICKTKSVLKILGRDKNVWTSYAEEFKNMIDNDLEKDIFLYIIENEDINRNLVSIQDVYLSLKNIYEGLKYEEVESALKNLILSGYISLKF